MINKNRDILENLGQELEKTARAPLSEFRIDENTAMPAERTASRVRRRA